MNDELRKATEAALLEAYPHISADAFRLLCWSAGIDPQFVEFQGTQNVQQRHLFDSQPAQTPF